MKLSDGEKLILTMLCEIYAHLKVKGEVDHQAVRSALDTGNYWEIVWQNPKIFGVHEDKSELFREVVHILDMWSLIETSYEKLSGDDKDKVRSQMPIHRRDIQFIGFHSRDESEWLEGARQLIRDHNRFSNFKGRDLDAHIPSLRIYRRMCSTFQLIRDSLDGRNLSATQLIEILLA